MKQLLTVILLILLLALQYRLWSGEGGLIRIWELSTSLEILQQENIRLQERNRTLEAEVLDLKQGLEAIEERARTELGMIRRGETFFQIVGSEYVPAAPSVPDEGAVDETEDGTMSPDADAIPSAIPDATAEGMVP